MSCRYSNGKFRGHRLCEKGRTSTAVPSDDSLKNDIFFYKRKLRISKVKWTQQVERTFSLEPVPCRIINYFCLSFRPIKISALSLFYHIDVSHKFQIPDHGSPQNLKICEECSQSLRYNPKTLKAFYMHHNSVQFCYSYS